ncbi:helix-turn-helix domain-containing protein [Streptomyces sp. NPDC054940]
MREEPDVLHEGERLPGTQSPLRHRLLEELREPASATVLAARLGESRQRLNDHLREMEKSGLVLGCAVGGSRPEHRGHHVSRATTRDGSAMSRAGLISPESEARPPRARCGCPRSRRC